jgi:hypothetical protein
MLRARVCDPAGPRWWRAVTGVGLLPLLLLGLVLPAPELPRIVTMLVGVSWLVLGRLVVPRPGPRACVVDVEPGAIVIHGAGVLSQRIAGADVRGASTAWLDGKVVLGLVRYSVGDSPLWLELDTAEDAERVRRALGIRYAGLGELTYPPISGSFHSQPTPADFLAGASWVALILAAAVGSDVALLLTLAVVPLTIIALAVAAARRDSWDRLTLSPRGVRFPLTTARSAPYTEVHWGDVQDVRATARGIALTTRHGEHHVPMRRAQAREREHFAAQIRTAARRARGEGPPPPEVPASVAVLAPRDEARRAWLERVDATAASIARAEGYRDLGVEEADLWSALESPDAPVPVRSAAARVLARVAPQQAGPRIAEVLAREHDEDTRTRIEVALEEDVELAARKLDRLDRAG